MASSRLVHLAVLNLLCAASPALAGDWSPDEARILGDPSFLPLAGQIEGSFGYSYSANLYDIQQESQFGSHASNDRSVNGFQPNLRFGITDDISVFANFDFGNSRNVEDETFYTPVFGPIIRTTPASTIGIIPSPIIRTGPGPFIRTVPERTRASFRSIGADNPEFGATWRVIDQARAPVSVDVIGAYSPDIFQGRAAALRQTGTLASGGQSGDVEVAVNREMRILTLRAYGEFDYTGRRNERAGAGVEDIRSAPHAIYTAGLQSEVRVLPFLAINAGISASQAVRYDRFLITSFGTSPQTIKPSGSLSPYGGIVVPLWDNRLVSEFLYQHDFINNQATEQFDRPATRFYKQESNVFTARVLFAFGGAPAPLPATAPPPLSAATPPVVPSRTYLVFFDWDRADLTARARQIVAQAAQAATQVQTTRIEVGGYTDLSGTPAYNQRLSVRRAQSVQAELVRDGVPSGEIGVQGHGESNPLVQTAQGVREPQNRRVEIVLR